MKASFKHIALMLAAGAFLAACNNGELDDPDSGKNNPQGDQTFEYLFSVNDAGLTRAVIEDDAIAFEEGDILGVIAKTPAKTSSTSAEVFFAEGGAKFAFSIKGQEGLKTGDAVYAWHPFSEENAATDPTNVTLTIPAEQEQTEADYNADAMPLVSAPFVAESTLPTGRKELAGEITMVPVGAVAEFNIYSTFPGFADQQIVSVTYTADGVSGNFNWDFTAEESAASGFTGNSITTTVQTTESVAATQADGAKVYMVLAPGERAASLMVKTTEAEYTLALASETYAAGQITAVDVNLEGAEWNVAKIYRYKFAATAEDELFGGLQDALGVFFGEEVLSKELAEGAFNIDKEEAVAANTTVAAYYPYTESAEDATALALNIPTEQTNLADGGWDKSYIPVVAAPVALTGEANAAEPNGTLAFRSLAAVAEFKMHSAYANTVGEKIRSVTLAAAAGGNFTWDLTAERADDAAWAVTGLDGTSVKASLAAETLVGADAENATSVFMVLAPGTYSGNLTVTTDRTSYSYSLENETFAMGEAKEISIELPSSSSDFAMALEALDGLAPVPAEGDKMALYGKEQNKIECEYTADNSFATPDEADVKGPFFAVYPADATHSIDFETGVLTGNVPEVQTLGEDKNVCDDAFVYYATGNTPAFTFKNATAFVKVEVAIDNVSEIKLTAKEGQAIAGAFTMELGAESTTVTAAEGASNTATLKPYGDTFAKGTYYIAVIPGASEGLTLDFKVKAAEDAEETFNRARTIENTVARNTITDLGLYFGYRIADAAQLLAWNNSNAEWTKWDIVTLTADINCKDVITSDNWTMRTFTGTFDGKGKTIDNFVFTKAGPAAFFNGLTKNSIVKNLTFGSGCSVTTTGLASNKATAAMLVVSAMDNASVENVVNYGSVTATEDAKGATSGYYIGGIASQKTSTGTFYGCKNYGTISSSAPGGSTWITIGGILGEHGGATTATLEACENHGAIIFNATEIGTGSNLNLGGIVGGANMPNFINCKNLGTVTCEAVTTKGTKGINIGGIVGLNNKYTIAGFSGCVNGEEGSTTKGALLNKAESNGEIRIGGCIGYIKANATAGEEVNTSVSGFTNYGAIENAGASSSNVGIGGVVGVIEGITGNEVSSCYNYGNLSNTGNLKPKDASSSVRLAMGGVVGWLKNANTNIQSVNNSGAVSNTGDLIKFNETSGNCGRASLGGILGLAQGGTTNNITSATNSGKVSNTKCDLESLLDLGGIVGHIDGNTTVGGVQAKDVVNDGEVHSKKKASGLGLGGIVGSVSDNVTSSVIKNCWNKKKVYHESWLDASSSSPYNMHGIGGILGYAAIIVSDGVTPATFTIQSCQNDGAVERTGAAPISGTHVGGIVGGIGGQNDPSTATITSCTNNGNVSHGGGAYRSDKDYYCYTGGVVGYFRCSGSVSLCTNNGTVTNLVEGAGSDRLRIGGIAGGGDCGTFTNCYNSGDVKDDSFGCGGAIGGIIGYAKTRETTLTNCDNSGNISGKFETSKNTNTNKGAASSIFLGGIVGASDISITFDGCDNGYNDTGSVYGGNVTNLCSSTAALSAGGILGRIESTSLNLTIKNSKNSGTIKNDSPLTSGKIAVGGIVGLAKTKKITLSDITANGSAVNNCKYKDANNTAVGGNEYVGGVVGQIDGDLAADLKNISILTTVSVQNTTRNGNHFCGIVVGRLTDKVESGSNGCGTAVSGVTVNAGTKFIAAATETAVDGTNLGTYTYGHGSNYGGQNYTVGKTYATTGISYVAQ